MDYRKNQLQVKPRARRGNTETGTTTITPGAVAISCGDVEGEEDEQRNLTAGFDRLEHQKRIVRRTRKEQDGGDDEDVVPIQMKYPGTDQEILKRSADGARILADEILEENDVGLKEDGVDDGHDFDNGNVSPLPASLVGTKNINETSTTSGTTVVHSISNRISALAESEAQMRRVLETAASAKVLADVDGRDTRIHGKQNIDEEDMGKSKHKRRRRIVFALAFGLLIAVAVIMAVVFSPRDQRPTDPTAAPTTSDNDPLQNVTIAEALYPMVGQDGDAFPATKFQAQALDWLEADLGQDFLIDPTKDELEQLVQRFTLTVLWFATNGTEWINSDLWLSSINECTWQGVSCNEQLVTDLDLSSNNLIGKIPTELVLLSGLVHLDLSGPKGDDFDVLNFLDGLTLTGPIPSKLHTISSLTYVDLSNNAISDQLPQLEDLMELTHLDLSYTDAFGSLPSEYGLMSALEYLDLTGNYLSGAIPTEYGGMTGLTHLSLAFNRGFGSLGLNQTIPGQLGRLTLLEHLNLQFNAFTGTIPQELGLLTALDYLNLNINELSGTLPTNLGLLTQLTWLNLCCNVLTGSLPDILGQLTVLLTLILGKNVLTGTIPPLPALMALEDLDLQFNSFTGTIPTWLGLLTSLDSLVLSNNLFSGPIPSLGTLTWLTNLDLEYYSGNDPSLFKVNNTFPPWLGQMQILTSLYLAGTNVHGRIPPLFDGDLEYLETLDVSTNNLSGTIPPFIGNLWLSSLNLSSNNLSGPIPSEIGNMEGLTSLSLSFNYLNGTIPTSLGFLYSVESLNLSNNKLTGSIPREIGEAMALSTFYIGCNTLSGPVPTSMVALPFLFDFCLYGGGNNFSMPIPAELAGLDCYDEMCIEGS